MVSGTSWGQAKHTGARLPRRYLPAVVKAGGMRFSIG